MPNIDYQTVINCVVSLITYCFPFSLIFGFTAKAINIALDMVFNKKIEM